MPLGDYEPSIAHLLRAQAERVPDRVLLAERAGDGRWRELTFAAARARADAVAQALLDRGLGPDRPVMALSGASIDHGVLMLGCFTAGVPIVPVSVAYSLQSRDFAKLRDLVAMVRPALVWADDGDEFGPALRAAGERADVVTGAPPAAEPGPDVDRALAAVGPDTVAKILFTSGSTGGPKGVITTQRMLCSNQQAVAQIWPFCAQAPPVLVDWLPWSHTFAGSHDFNHVIKHGGSLYLDAGKPLPGQFETTLRNLRDVPPTVYLSVPAAFAALVPALERDAELAERFFSRLRLIFYAGAALPRDLWDRLRALSGGAVEMTTSWGATETAPAVTSAHFPLDGPGNIGVPIPGCELRLAPVGERFELRVRGPNVTPGYFGRPDLAAVAFDREGFYRTGDAGELVDPDDGARGVRFAGRLAEEFKLTTGTFVRVGTVRTDVLAACDGLLRDAVVTGHDRAYLGLLAWVNQERASGEPVAERLRQGLRAHNAEHPGSSTRIERVIVLDEPPSLDAGEVTDKGYVNQRAVLERRAEAVERLYAESPGDDVIVVSSPASLRSSERSVSRSA